MERLTKRINGYAHGAEGVSKDKLTGAYCRGKFEATACVEKLAEYETLEEQCIEENTCCLRMLLKKWKEFFADMKELYDYRKLEEQGLLVKLPNDFKKWCDKIGDYIWFVTGGDICPVLVLWIGFNGNMDFVISTINDYKDGDGLSFEFKLEDLRKTVFLTQAEAEEALKRMEGENETCRY